MSKFKLPSEKQVNDIVTFKYLNITGATRRGRIFSITFTEEFILYEVYAFETGEIHFIKESQLVDVSKNGLKHNPNTVHLDADKKEILRIRNVEVEVCDRVVIFTYRGKGDPDEALSDEIKIYAKGRPYQEFVDINPDNPWTTIIVFD